MATFWEGAAHSVYHMFSLYFDIAILVISDFGFWGRGFGSDCTSSWSLLIFYFFHFDSFDSVTVTCS